MRLLAASNASDRRTQQAPGSAPWDGASGNQRGGEGFAKKAAAGGITFSLTAAAQVPTPPGISADLSEQLAGA
jgi:hypothetical protein